MRVLYTGFDPVDQLYGVNISGNLVPKSWCHSIVNKNGRPNMNAVMILAEIVYWYRPKVEENSENGTVRLKKKFKADLLQISYAKLEDELNLSRDQCKRAVRLLEELGLIKRRFETITTGDGRQINNVMYIELFVENVLSITKENVFDPEVIKPHSCTDETTEHCEMTNVDVRIEPQTNTKINTDITNKDYQSFLYAETARVREQIDYEYLIIDRKTDRGIVDNIVDLMTEINMSENEYQVVNGERKPTALVRERLSRINIYMVKAVIEKLQTVGSPVRNMKGYLLTMLFNEPVTYETELDVQVRQDMYGREMVAMRA